MDHSRPVRAAVTGLLVTAAATLIAPAASAASTAPTCRNATVVVSPATVARANAATLCLVNRQRAARGIRPLRRDADLSAAATRYARQMVRQRFFDHVSPSGSTVLGRLKEAGYLDGVRSYAIGENIAWGTGRYGTPQSIVASWMRSPGHRENILSREFREIGLGVATGNPGGGRGGATYVHDFGTRRR